MAVTEIRIDESNILHSTLSYGLAKPFLFMGLLGMVALIPRKLSSESIGSLSGLCKALHITEEELREAISLPEQEKYKELTRPKSDGSLRVVHNPCPPIRKIQRRINNRIFSDRNIVGWPDHIYGSIPNQLNDSGEWLNKDYVACAAKHCGAKSVLKLDIKDFFDNIHQALVLQVFQDFFKYSSVVAEVLAEVCCFNGRVVQGGLTSSYLACLCLFDVEGAVVEKLLRKKLVYTRLVDDITISSMQPNYDFSYAQNLVMDMLSEKELPLNAAKTKIQRVSSEPLLVHGLRVAFAQPRLPADEVRRIRAAVKNVEILASEGGYRTTHAFRRDFNRCMGRVNKLSRVEHNQHQPLVNRLRKILPLPSQKDIEIANAMIARLEKDYSAKNNTYWFKKRFHAAQERLHILGRKYPAIATALRSKLKLLQPAYE